MAPSKTKRKAAGAEHSHAMESNGDDAASSSSSSSSKTKASQPKMPKLIQVTWNEKCDRVSVFALLSHMIISCKYLCQLSLPLS